MPGRRPHDEGRTGRNRARPASPLASLPGADFAARIGRLPARFHSELLVKTRLDLGLTQEQAAHAVGVDVRTYRRYESGEVNEGGGFEVGRASRRKLLQRLCRELGLAEDDLVVTREAPPAPDREPELDGAHVLARAAHFVGRSELLARLGAWLEGPAPSSRVVALVGLGGAGKTSVLERALGAARRRAFVWSFYDDPRTEAFFEAARRAIERGAAAAPGEQVERLLRALAGAASPVLVLDGLEAVQAPGDRGRARGELEDARLRLLLRAIARGAGHARAVVTSRFALADLAAWEGDGLETHRLAPLSEAESIELLRRWGLRGSARELQRLAGAAGGHALSTAVLGSYVGASLGGDPARFATAEAGAGSLESRGGGARRRARAPARPRARRVRGHAVVAGSRRPRAGLRVPSRRRRDALARLAARGARSRARSGARAGPRSRRRSPASRARGSPSRRDRGARRPTRSCASTSRRCSGAGSRPCTRSSAAGSPRSSTRAR